MATLKDLFKQKETEVYGKTGKIFIESRGFINPPRGAALLASSPNALADLIGNQIGGAWGGNANRVSDTIFKNNTPFSKPISLFKTQQGLKNAIKSGDQYYIKQSPSPSSLFAQIKNGGSTVGGVLANAAIKAVTKGGLKNIKKQLEGSPENTYGVKYGNAENGKLIKNDKKFSEYYKNKEGKLQKRDLGFGDNGAYWEDGQYIINNADKITDDELKKAEKNGHIVVTFGKIIDDMLNVDFNVPFIGSVTGISEDIQSEWTNFRYIGSPFKVNRFIGVERTIKFNLKLYYITSKEKDVMIKKINYLKSLTFPDTTIKTITFGDDKESQYSIAPNIVKFSMGSLYKNMPTILESLSFTIDDNISWPKMGYNKFDWEVEEKNDFETDNNDENFMYPSVVNVAISLKIIENHKIDTSNNTKVYKYDFDGLNQNDKYTIKK
jgi:hypothetical protein